MGLAAKLVALACRALNHARTGDSVRIAGNGFKRHAAASAAAARLA
jgi:hypothetical protein